MHRFGRNRRVSGKVRSPVDQVRTRAEDALCRILPPARGERLQRLSHREWAPPGSAASLANRSVRGTRRRLPGVRLGNGRPREPSQLVVRRSTPQPSARYRPAPRPAPGHPCVARDSGRDDRTRASGRVRAEPSSCVGRAQVSSTFSPLGAGARPAARCVMSANGRRPVLICRTADPSRPAKIIRPIGTSGMSTSSVSADVLWNRTSRSAHLSGPSPGPGQASADAEVTRRVILRITAWAGYGARAATTGAASQESPAHRVKEGPHPSRLQGRDQTRRCSRVRGAVRAPRPECPPDRPAVNRRIGLPEVEHRRVPPRNTSLTASGRTDHKPCRCRATSSVKASPYRSWHSSSIRSWSPANDDCNKPVIGSREAACVSRRQTSGTSG